MTTELMLQLRPVLETVGAGVVVLLIAKIVDLVVYHRELKHAKQLYGVREARANVRDSGRMAAYVVLCVGTALIALWKLVI